MLVPDHMHITDGLTAGYTFSDGSLLEVDGNGDFQITDASGEILHSTFSGPAGEGVENPNGWEDYGEIADDVAAFLGHDGEIYEFTEKGSWGKRYPDSVRELDTAELIFSESVAAWADAHSEELSMLACYREDKELGEGEIDDEEEGIEPGDYVISDSGYLLSRTSVSVHEERSIGEFDTEEEAEAAIREDMERNRFWPKVWRISDHGNVSPVTLGDEG